jgi:hypothetical protein
MIGIYNNGNIRNLDGSEHGNDLSHAGLMDAEMIITPIIAEKVQAQR